MAYEEVETTQLAHQARGHTLAGEKAQEKANDHLKAAGLYLIEAKSRIKHGEWGQYLADHYQLGERSARTTMAIAAGKTTIEEVRQKKADGMRNSRASSKSAPRGSEMNSPTDTIKEARGKVTSNRQSARLKRVLAMVEKLNDYQLEALETKLKEILV